MRIRFFVVLVSLSSLSAQSESRMYLQPADGPVGVYAQENPQSSDDPVFMATEHDLLLVQEEKGDFCKVSSGVGLTGWVEKRLCRVIGKSRSYLFDTTDINGYPDNPKLIPVGVANPPDDEPLCLYRNFRAELRDNIDQETAVRRNSDY